MKQLIVNADDYGRTPAISKGIRYAHHNGLVTTTTTMMNYATAQADLKIAQTECPNLGLGVHLTLTSGSPVLPAAQIPSLVNAQGDFLKLGQLEQVYADVNPTELKAEWRAQIEKFLATGTTIDHFDSHHHTAYYTDVSFGTLLDLAAEYGAPIRRPRALTEANDRLGFTERLLGQRPTRCPDHFITSFYDEGVTLPNLLHILQTLPEGLTELMSHPGYVDEEILSGSSYNSKREEELALLTNPEAKSALQSLGITLVTFRQALSV
jgi:chitin disaccharide deacetylase